ncbi:hypothetical protein IZ6_25260 [Terrihabitans soli]|uniref:Phage portal protein n=1 Tax=Terrihabitans soli TaxID=708113 RepID=A0A6S6QXN6_9HYPH|nr:hypothetical protein [Terrihabitans soli]BCJ91791.1 hypothetical protein IZ6_25260 [Terrihabitans soli]
MALNFGSLFTWVLPKKKGKKGGVGLSATFDPNANDGVLTVPQYREHLTDLFSSRQANDSRVLLQELFKTDPDVSAALNAYLTMSNTEMLLLARTVDGQIDREATKQLQTAFKLLSTVTDYSLGFQLKPSMKQVCENLRYMALLRGSVGVELVLSDKLAPSELRQVDMADVEWREKKSGEYKPIQKPEGSNDEINLDIPTFFVSHFRRDPTNIYSWSYFVAAINTIAARQQVINDLYRIMQVTGYPRLDVKVVEEVLLKNAPANIKADQVQLKSYMASRLAEIQSSFATMRADQAIVHFDSVEPKIINDRQPGMAVDISSVIQTLNAQNQAGLKTMSTVIGRGESGVNTSSVEARIAAMNADELNEPIADILTKVGNFILHSNGFQGWAEVTFRHAELRPDLELEPQLMLKSQRLRQDLSDGLITDEEYHLLMYGRLPPDGAPELSGTGFLTPAPAGGEAGGGKGPTSNSDPLGRSLSPEGNPNASRSKAIKAALLLMDQGGP